MINWPMTLLAAAQLFFLLCSVNCQSIDVK